MFVHSSRYLNIVICIPDFPFANILNTMKFRIIFAHALLLCIAFLASVQCAASNAVVLSDANFEANVLANVNEMWLVEL